MSAADSQRLLQHIRRLAGDPPGAPSDAELLRRYLERREQAAFSALIRRHGPMVFAACQSILRQEQDAEDAFQATFLILMQKAGSIRQQHGLGGWLQRVAYRVALRARANRLRRRSSEEQTARAPAVEPSCEDLSWRELRSILHAELAALPEKVRAPLVLCYLEGLTQEEAAFRLGWTAATVKGRLQRGREKLRHRLERRGVALTAALGAALTGQALAESAVPALRPFTVETATTAATALAHDFGPALASMKWKLLAVVVFSAGLAAGGVGMLSPKLAEEGPTTTSAGKPAAERTGPNTDLYGDPLPKGAIARMGSIQLRHAGQSDFLILPDGKTVLTAGGRVVRFWDIATGRLRREVKLEGPFAPGRSATPSPDGKILAGMDQKKIVFWDIESGKQIKTYPDTRGERPAGTYFSPDGKTLILTTWKPQVILLGWKKGSERRIALFPRRIGMDSTFHTCVSPDGKLLAGGGGFGESLVVYDLATGRELHRFSCNASASTFSPDSKRLIVASMHNDKKAREAVIRVFDVANGKEVSQYSLGHDDSYFSLSCAADGKTLACAFSDRSCLLDLTTGRVLHPLTDRPIRTDFAPDGRILVANLAYRLRMWDTVTGKVLHDRPGDFGWKLASTVSPDGRLLAEADWMDQSVSLWDTASGRLLRRLPLKGEKRYVRNLAFSPDGKTLFAGQSIGFLQFWDTDSGKEQRTVQLHDPGRRNSDFVYFVQLHVSPDGKHVSTLERLLVPKEATRLAYWDIEIGKIVKQHLLPPNVRDCAWSAEGTRVVLPLKDGLTAMDVESGAVRFCIPGTRNGGPLAVSSDGRLLAAVLASETKDKAVVGIWEAATGKEIATLTTGPLSHLGLMSDNRHLVATDDRSLRLWDLATGKELRRWPLPEVCTFVGGIPVVTGFQLFPDGRRAVTALNDGTALVWDLQPALHRGKPLDANPGEKELAAWWNDLAADDARRAYAAIWRLTEAPEAAIRLFRQHLKPATDAETKAIRRLIADLDSDEFATREKAFKQLAELAAVAEPALRHALEQKPMLEARRRLEHLLEKIDRQPASGESLRLLRALQVLEDMGKEGRRLLRELASGAEGAWLTRTAQAMLAKQNQSAP